MTEILETSDLIDAWLYSTLSTDATLISLVGDRIVNTASPVELGYPYIVFNSASTRPIRGVGGVVIDTDSLYDIKCVTEEASYEQASNIAARFRLLLDKANVTTSPPLTPVMASIACWWELEIRFPEIQEGVWYRHLGGTYRIRAVEL
jgi:hypothetical protein